MSEVPGIPWEKPRLFKFLSPERTDVLQRKLIRFTQPSAFNDPFEAFPAIGGICSPDTEEEVQRAALEYVDEHPDVVREVMEGSLKEKPRLVRFLFKMLLSKKQVLKITKDAVPQLLRELNGVPTPENSLELAEQLREAMASQVGVLSMSAVNSNILLWSHYAGSHAGFALEFDLQHPFFSEENEGVELPAGPFPVRYDEVRPSLGLLHLRPDLVNLSDSLFSAFLLTKSVDWSYEEEWRMFRPLAQAAEKRPGDVFLFPFPPEAIKGVILGARMSPTHREEVLEALRQDPGFSETYVDQAHLNHPAFGLRFEHIIPSAI